MSAPASPRGGRHRLRPGSRLGRRLGDRGPRRGIAGSLVALVLALLVSTGLGGAPAAAGVASGAGSAPASTSPAVPPPAPVPDAASVALPSTKKGVASYAYLSSDVSKLTRLGTSWAYNWSPVPPPDAGGMEFVPMLWGSGSLDDATLRDLRDGAATGRYSALLGFNEPDLHDQANMTVEQALSLWPQLESTGLRLVSPAPTSPWNGWLESFMTGAGQRGYRVDAVALHYYQDWTDPESVRRLEGELREVHRRYGKPIWITEIGAFDLRAWGMSMQREPTHERADAYMREVVALLESLPFVERYAWFDDNCWSLPECRYSSLYDDRHELTSHGSTYTAATPSPPVPLPGTPVPAPPVGDPARMLAAAGPVLRDRAGDGEVVDLRGTNLGGWLLQEGWMSPAGEAPLNRSGWSARASAAAPGEGPERALDGDPGTRWSTGREQAVGQTFTVDLGAPRTFDEVSFAAGASTGDSPPGVRVRASADGATWWDVGSSAGTARRTVIHTDYQTARYVQLVVTAADPARHWWSITEFHAYVSDEFNTRRVLTERFGAAVADSLIARYQDAWLRESDLDVIQGLGMNVVRAPIDWQVIMRPDGTMRPDADAFRKLDWLVTESARRGLYVILDLHGAPGAACPWHSCGQAGSNALWTSATQQDRAVRIWQRIAARYAGNSTVAGYDLLNEPLTTSGAAESPEQVRQKFDLYDRLYDAVRQVDPGHLLIIAAFFSWDNALPPSAYGWTNVMYETHNYASGTADHAAVTRFIDDELARIAHHRAEWQVPVYAGEFWVGGSHDLYTRWLTGLDTLHASWTGWTYKVRGGGNWGLYQNSSRPVPDLAVDSAQAIGDAWAAFGTSAFEANTALQTVFRDAATRPVTPVVPTTVEAEAYVAVRGLRSETTTDVGGGLNLGWADPGDVAEYDVVVPVAGQHSLTLRVSSPGGAAGALRVVTAGSSVPVSVPATHGWQTWADVTVTVPLGAGVQRLRLHVDQPGWNLGRLTLAEVRTNGPNGPAPAPDPAGPAPDRTVKDRVDMDGDGRSDVVWVTADGQWWFSSGGRASWVRLAGAAEAPLERLRLADVDGDGRSDVVWVTAGGQWWFSSGGRASWARLAGAAEAPLERLALA